jgi:hypothetical protein
MTNLLIRTWSSARNRTIDSAKINQQDLLLVLERRARLSSSRVDRSYKECTVTITTSKNGARFRSVVKILRPHGKGKVLMMMGDSFRSVEMADDYGMKLAREWINKHVK